MLVFSLLVNTVTIIDAFIDALMHSQLIHKNSFGTFFLTYKLFHTMLVTICLHLVYFCFENLLRVVSNASRYSTKLSLFRRLLHHDNVTWV